MLEVAVRKRLGGFSLDVDFRVPSNGVTALFGPSGAGKTSVLSVLAGLSHPDKGRIALDGAVLYDHVLGQCVAAHRRAIGYVFQDSRLFPHMTVEGNLRYGLRRSRGRTETTTFAAAVAMLGIEKLLPRLPHRLSGGEKQRVAIGRALLSQPRLLLLDEPLASLDDARKAEILPYLEKLRDELRVPMIYVSHTLEETVRLATTMVILSGGRSVAAGSLEELSSRTDVAMLSERADAGTVLEATVAEHDEKVRLTRLSFAGGSLLVPRSTHPAGSRVRVRVLARDVALALRAPALSSFQNVLAGSIVELRERSGDVLVRIAVGDAHLLSAVTVQAVERLRLRPGLTVHALLKSVALAAPNLQH
ncbi:MAG TPA: molybdenum ABC transporter ATP-binding protein [Candidatus Limnocylindrales bacterium]|nr:molybdenum ABC transporter ATP-binding protein [Candidatus Limnocylindrales bacterium]